MKFWGCKYFMSGWFLDSLNVFKSLKFRNNFITSAMNHSQSATVNGISLHYEKVGKGNHPVLLIPGALGCAATDFSKQLEKMNRENFTIIGYDPRGYGGSRPPDKLFNNDFLKEDAADAAELMKTLGFESYSLLGWSDGANIAAIMAAKHTARIRKLVMWGGNSYVTPEELQLYKNVRDVATWSPKMKQPMVDVYGEEAFESLWHAWVDVFCQMPKEDDGNIDLFRKRLVNIKCPTLIIHGDKDALVPKFQAEFLHKNIAGSRLVCWEDGKHNLHMRHDDRFNKLVQDFLISEGQKET